MRESLHSQRKGWDELSVSPRDLLGSEWDQGVAGLSVASVSWKEWTITPKEGKDSGLTGVYNCFCHIGEGGCD